MMKTSFTLILASAFLLGGCAEDELFLENSNDGNNITQLPSFKISSETAIEQAKGFLSELNPATRGVNRRLSDITLIGDKAKTRSGENCDSLLYLINFADDGGFVLMSADVRSIPIYAISDKGNFVINEENREQMTAIIEGAKQDIIAATDTFKYTGNENIFPWPGFRGWDKTPINYKIEPKLCDFQSKIGNSGVYAQYCHTSDGKPAKSGCLAVATEQILSYYQHPTYIDGKFISWENANSSNGTQTVAKILWLIGSKKYLNLTYGTGDTIAYGNHDNIPPTLTKLGYQHCGKFKQFYKNDSIAIGALNYGPILMRARSSKHNTGHAWVIDGMIQYKVEKIQYIGLNTTPSYIYPNLYHCVWGFDGDCNGYYYADLYGFIGNPCVKDPKDSPTNNNTINIYSDKDVVFMYGFRPIR